MGTPIRHSLDQLLVLDAVVRTGSFAGAARELHRVPSAVSYTVKSLEDVLGFPLFDRSGHRAVLTPEGRRIHEEAAEVLRRARRLEQLAGRLGAGWEAELRVVVDGVIPMAPISRVLQHFRDLGVPTRVHVDVEYQDGVLDRFDADHADLMLALGLEDGGRLQGVELPPLEMVLVAGAVHPLASMKGVDPAVLSEHVDLVVKDSSPRYRKEPRKAFLGSRHVVRLSDFHSKRQAIEEGVGFGWLPLHLAAAGLASGALVLIDLPDGNRWSYRPQLITRREEPPGRAGQLFVDRLLLELGQSS